jgi:nucleotide-binding universal stress UspA family protein
VVSTQADLEGERALAVQAEFNRRCDEAGVSGRLAIAAGKVTGQVCARSRWTDLVVMKLDHPPPPKVLGKLGSGFRTILRRCAGPVLAVPSQVSSLSHALLAYDGSPKAQEALFVAAYLAGCWQIALTIVTVAKSTAAAEKTQARGQEYLNQHDLRANFVQKHGAVASAILETAQEDGCDLVIMGGYGRHPVAEVTLGSVVGEVLGTSQQPTLICQ